MVKVNRVVFVTLTNASPGHMGKPIAIRRDLIVTVYPGTVLREDGSSDEVTYVFCPPHGTWEVVESFEDVLDTIQWNSI